MSSISPYFNVDAYEVVSKRGHKPGSSVEARVEVRIGTTRKRCSATGVGPVHALDNALRECLESDFPELGAIRLSDYRVSVVDAGDGTAAQVRVLVQATDGEDTWDVSFISRNMIEASLEALCSATVLGIMRRRSAALATESSPA